MLAPNLRAIREQRGLTQYGLARAAGLSASYISKLEAGHARRPSAQTLERLAKALNVSIAELRGDTVWNREPAMDAAELALARRVLPLLRRVKGINPEELLRQ